MEVLFEQPKLEPKHQSSVGSKSVKLPIITAVIRFLGTSDFNMVVNAGCIVIMHPYAQVLNTRQTRPYFFLDAYWKKIQAENYTTLAV